MGLSTDGSQLSPKPQQIIVRFTSHVIDATPFSADAVTTPADEGWIAQQPEDSRNG